MPPSREVWASAFAAQSRSDWQVYDRLTAEPEIPSCHKLHYLQMACEKIAKAYRCRDTGTNLEELLKRHVGFAKFIGSFLASPSVKEAYQGRDAQLREVSRLTRALAREIEKLAPAVDRAGSPENAEYSLGDRRERLPESKLLDRLAHQLEEGSSSGARQAGTVADSCIRREQEAPSPPSSCRAPRSTRPRPAAPSGASRRPARRRGRRAAR